MLQNQVKLPINVAFGVVTQGMRIRFGRSLVTIIGVVGLGMDRRMRIVDGWRAIEFLAGMGLETT